MFHLAYIDPGSLYTVSSGLAAVIGFALSALAVVALFFRRLGGFVRRHWVWATAVFAVAVAVIAALLIGRDHKDGSVMAGNEQGKRLIIVGLDGLSPKIIEPMMAEGKLPNFQRLKDLGGYSHLGTTNPAESPVAWTSFATGRNPGEARRVRLHPLRPRELHAGPVAHAPGGKQVASGPQGQGVLAVRPGGRRPDDDPRLPRDLPPG